MFAESDTRIGCLGLPTAKTLPLTVMGWGGAAFGTGREGGALMSDMMALIPETNSP